MRKYITHHLVQLLTVRVVLRNALEVGSTDEQILHTVEATGEISNAAFLGRLIDLLTFLGVDTRQVHSERTTLAPEEGRHSVWARE